jgi:TnpA family transposase
MTDDILTQAERLEFDELPTSLSADLMTKYFTLSKSEIDEAKKCRGAENQVGFALQFCALRMIGRFPTDLKQVPIEVINYLASQLNVASFAEFNYPQREQTKWDHADRIRQMTQFELFDQEAMNQLSVALREQALQCNQSRVLMAFAREKLYRDKIVRPSADTLERLIAQIKKQVEAEIFSFISAQLDVKMKQTFEKLLVVEENSRFSPLQLFKKPPPAASPNAILALLGQIDTIREIGINKLDFSPLSENKVKYLAKLGKGYSTSPMLRFDEQKRYSLLSCFLHETLTETIDTAIDMYNALITSVIRRSKNDLDTFTREVAQETNEMVLLFKDIGSVLLSEEISDQEVRNMIYQEVIPKEQLQQKVEACETLARPLDYNCLDFVEARYNYTRQFSVHFLETINLRPYQEEDDLFIALKLIKQCNKENIRKIPSSAPTSFVPKSWMEQMKQEDGTLDRHFYELCTLVKLRDALRSGDIWVEGSRRYLPLSRYLFSDDHWALNRQKYYEQLSLPEKPHQFIAEMREKFMDISTKVDNNIAKNTFASIVDGALSLSSDKASPQNEEVKQLKQSVHKVLPRIILIEVDKWTNFTRHFTCLGGQEPRTTSLHKSLFANFMAQGCNIGLVNMADSTPDITYRQLFHVSTWYINDDTLRKAMAEIINFQHRLPLASVWGDGTKSTSDGIRLNVPVNAFGATFHPKYFGKYGRGVTRYSFLSDQFAEFYTIIIPNNLRESTFVLDGLLNNETDLNPQQHFTDEHGYTENVFALASLLGFRFCPRFKDWGDKKIYKLSDDVYSNIELLFHEEKTNRVRVINTSLIIEQWDNIVRLVASLKNRKVTASLLIQKMSTYSRAGRLIKAIQEVGRIFQTLYILEYIDNPQLRGEVRLHLTRHESKNTLARYLFFGEEGELRRRDYDSQMERISCLSLLINCIVTWNTHYLSLAIQQLLKEGHKINDELVAHISPLMHAHINPYGVYYFNIP